MAYVNPDNIPVDNQTRYHVDEGVLRRVPISYLVIGGIMLAMQVIGCIIIRKKPSPKDVSFRYIFNDHFRANIFTQFLS